MRIDDLTKHGIPSRIVEIWRARQGETLLPVQRRALRRGLLGASSGESSEMHDPLRMIVAAPTSSGKSFCAEMAIVRTLADRRKAVWLLPLKSLAEQKYRALSATYGSLGVKVAIASGDHPENDTALAAARFDIAVAIYEKLDLLLTSNLDLLSNVGLIVVDELQTVSEPGRGAVLERLLTKVLASVYQPRLLGLSAVIADSSRSAQVLAEWLGADLVEETSRPVDLLRGVAADGAFRFRSYNTGIDGTEPFAEIDAGEEAFAGLIRQVKEQGGSSLVFLKSRRDTVEAAFQLAAAVDRPAASGALEDLDGEEPSYLVRALRQVLGRGVAFHNADLSPRQRAVVESAFVRREVTTVFATTTLAMGVDLPADTVYLETVKYSEAPYSGKPSLVPVSRAEFDNMTGRAGRLGLSRGNAPGKAVVLAQSEFERDILWETYLSSDRTAALVSALGSMPTTDLLLDLAAAGLVRRETDLPRLVDCTLWAQTSDIGELRSRLETAVDHLIDASLIRRGGDSGGLVVTALGSAVARSGLRVDQAVWFRRRLDTACPETDFGWMALALSAPGWTAPTGAITRVELAQSAPLRLLLGEHDDLVSEARFLLGQRSLREPLDRESSVRLKILLLLERWRRVVPVRRLEESFQMHLGQIMAVGETAAHLVSGLAAVIAAQDRTAPVQERLLDLVFGLRFGLSAEARPLHAAFSDILTRSDIAALLAAGVGTPSQMAQLSPEKREGLVTGKRKLALLAQRLDSLEKEKQMATNLSVETPRPPAPLLAGSPQLVEIDGHFERERYLVKVDGFPVRLTGKSFKYLTRLAWARVSSDGGWVYKEDLESGFNQARYLYRMKNEINDNLGMPWSVVENNRLGYYRLNLDPSRLRLNLDTLRSHPDWEVRSLFLDGARSSSVC